MYRTTTSHHLQGHLPEQITFRRYLPPKSCIWIEKTIPIPKTIPCSKRTTKRPLVLPVAQVRVVPLPATITTRWKGLQPNHHTLDPGNEYFMRHTYCNRFWGTKQPKLRSRALHWTLASPVLRARSSSAGPGPEPRTTLWGCIGGRSEVEPFASASSGFVLLAS